MNGFDPDRDPWQPWSPAQVHARLHQLDVPWYVAGGWALDLFLAGEPRGHEDIEIGVPTDAFDTVAHAFADHDLFLAGDGVVQPLDGATPADRAAHHQVWVRDPQAGCWRLDILREPSRDGRWVCRRDARLTLPYGDLIARTAAGIPFGRPEVILLFKAKACRPKDEADFARVLPRLGGEARRWLADALALAHPGHPWLAALA